MRSVTPAMNETQMTVHDTLTASKDEHWWDRMLERSSPQVTPIASATAAGPGRISSTTDVTQIANSARPSTRRAIRSASGMASR